MATLYPAVMVTKATDEVQFELARINEAYQHKHSTLNMEIAAIISHVKSKRMMGYRMFDTFEINTATLIKAVTYGATVVVAIIEVRHL